VSPVEQMSVPQSAPVEAAPGAPQAQQAPPNLQAILGQLAG
jgi:hypothetical protein